MFGSATTDSMEYDDEEVPGRGPFSRFGRWVSNLGGRDDEEVNDDYVEEPEERGQPHASAQPRTSQRRDGLRFTSTTPREDSIRVMPVGSFSDIQKAADRLKAGEPQIVNLEKTPADVAERLIDFLNGVTYALDGYVEKVAEAAYLFTPPHIAIHADSPDPGQAHPFVSPHI